MNLECPKVVKYNKIVTDKRGTKHRFVCPYDLDSYIIIQRKYSNNFTIEYTDIIEAFILHITYSMKWCLFNIKPLNRDVYLKDYFTMADCRYILLDVLHKNNPIEYDTLVAYNPEVLLAEKYPDF